MLTAGAYQPETPLSAPSLPTARPNMYAMLVFHVEAITVSPGNAVQPAETVEELLLFMPEGPS